MHGISISEVEVVQIDSHGLWIHVKGMEYFLSYLKYPWFKEAKIEDILNVQLLHNTHLYWPSIDVDLSISILENPEKYQLVYQ